MAGDYGKKTQSADQHLANLTGAKFKHVDGSVITPINVIPSGVGGRLLKLVLNTKGNIITLRTGSRVIAVISATASEGTYHYGVYCENGLIVECAGAVDATVVFA